MLEEIKNFCLANKATILALSEKQMANFKACCELELKLQNRGWRERLEAKLQSYSSRSASNWYVRIYKPKGTIINVRI